MAEKNEFAELANELVSDYRFLEPSVWLPYSHYKAALAEYEQGRQELMRVALERHWRNINEHRGFQVGRASG